MIEGLIAGALWALDTVIIAFAMKGLGSYIEPKAILLAPIVSMIFHEMAAVIWMSLYMLIRKKINNILSFLKTRKGKIIIFSSILGGPIGMSAYAIGIYYIGASYTAVIVSLFPASGAILAFLFLGDKLRRIQILGLVLCILGSIGVGYSPTGEVQNMAIGIVFAFICILSWSSEAVIIAHTLKADSVDQEMVYSVRVLVSAITYIVIFILVVSHYVDVKGIVSASSSTIGLVALAALCGVGSYLLYFKSIRLVGAAKAMALNVTFSAWAVVFSFFILGSRYNISSILFGIVLVLGSLITANKGKS